MYQIMKNVLGIRQVTCCGNILWLPRCWRPSPQRIMWQKRFSKQQTYK